MTQWSLQEITAKDMDKFLSQQTFGSFTQNSNQKELDSFNQRETLYVALFDGDYIVAAGKYTLRKVMRYFYVATSVLGPILDYDNPELVSVYFQKLKSFFRKKRVIHLTILPRVEMGRRDEDGNIIEEADWSIINYLEAAGLKFEGFKNDFQGILQRFIFLKDLRNINNKEELADSYDSKTRNLIRKAKRNDIYLREVGIEEMDKFAKIMISTSKRRDFQNRQSDYYKNFMKAYGPKQVMTVLAFINPEEAVEKQNNLIENINQKIDHRKEKIAHHQGNQSKLEGQIKELTNQLRSFKKKKSRFEEIDEEGEIAISGAMFVTFNGEMTYLYSGTLAKYLDLDASHLIQDYAQAQAVGRDCHTYNYFGTLGEFCGEDGGIHHFKKGFGGRVVELPGAFTMSIHPLLGKLYEWKNN